VEYSSNDAPLPPGAATNGPARLLISCGHSPGRPERPMSESPARQRAHLRAIARQAMIERGLEPDFPQPALAELARIQGPARPAGPGGGQPGAGNQGGEDG